jgi:hypothetical protein
MTAKKRERERMGKVSPRELNVCTREISGLAGIYKFELPPG